MFNPLPKLVFVPETSAVMRSLLGLGCERQGFVFVPFVVFNFSDLQIRSVEMTVVRWKPFDNVSQGTTLRSVATKLTQSFNLHN